MDNVNENNKIDNSGGTLRDVDIEGSISFDSIAATNLTADSRLKADINKIIISEDIDLNEIGNDTNGYLNAFGDNILYYETNDTISVGNHGGYLSDLSSGFSLSYNQKVRTNVTNTTTETTLIDITGAYSNTAGLIVPEDGGRVGSIVRLEMKGELDNMGTVNNDITLRFYVGATVVTDLFVNLPSLVGTGNGFTFDIDIILDTLDSVNGIIRAIGNFNFLLNNGNSRGVNLFQETTGLDTTFPGNADLDVTIEWTQANATNIFRVDKLFLYDRT